MHMQRRQCFGIARQFNSFRQTVATLGFALPELTVPQLVDCLASMTHSRAQQSDAMSGNFTLKALRWFRKIARCSLFGDSVLTIGRQFLEGAFDFR